MSEPSVREELTRIAGRMAEISQALGMPRLAGTIVSDTRRRLDDARIRAVVIGEIKHGKSTLINALLGESALPSGVTPTTATVVTVRAARDDEALGPRALDADGRIHPLDPDAFVERVRGRGAAEPESDTSSRSIDTLEVLVPTERLPAGLDLVDTPGINDLSRLRAAVSQGELPRADVLLLVLDATQLLNRSELGFLSGAIAAVGGLQDSGATLLLAVNRIDLIAERERPKLLEHLKRSLGALTRGEGPSEADAEACPYEVFLTDARGALRDPSVVTPGTDGVRELRERLAEVVAKQGDLLPMRARASLLRFGALLGHNAAIASRAATLEPEGLSRELEEVQRELVERELDLSSIRTMMSDARTRLLEESGQRVKVFQGELYRSIDACIEGASQRTLSSHLAAAVHDAVLAFASEESTRLRTSLDEVTRKVLHTHSEQLNRRIAHATMRLGFRGPTIYIEPPSALLEAGLVAVGVAGTAIMYFGNVVMGLVMAVAGPLTTVFLREHSIRQARARARAELPQALATSAAALSDQIRKIVDGHLAGLEEHVLLANISLREQIEGVLETTRARLETGGSDGEALPPREQVKGELADLEQEISSLRAGLLRLGAA